MSNRCRIGIRVLILTTGLVFIMWLAWICWSVLRPDYRFDSTPPEPSDLRLIELFSDKSNSTETRIQATNQMLNSKKPAIFVRFLVVELDNPTNDQMNRIVINTVGIIGHPSALPALYRTRSKFRRYSAPHPRVESMLDLAIVRCEKNRIWKYP